MRKFLIVPTLALTLAAAGSAFASMDDVRADAPRAQWKTVAQIAEMLAARGYQVRELKIDDGVYEVEAIDRDGRRIEADVHPVTGEILKLEHDD